MGRSEEDSLDTAEGCRQQHQRLFESCRSPRSEAATIRQIQAKIQAPVDKVGSSLAQT